MLRWIRRLFGREKEISAEKKAEIDRLAAELFPTGNSASASSRVDLRTDEQRQWESEASSGKSLGQDLDLLAEELRQIYLSVGFVTKSASGDWNKNQRVIEIGEEIYDISGGASGGLDAMLKVSLKVKEQCGSSEAYSDLSLCWNHVREWLN